MPASVKTVDPCRTIAPLRSALCVLVPVRVVVSALLCIVLSVPQRCNTGAPARPWNGDRLSGELVPDIGQGRLRNCKEGVLLERYNWFLIQRFLFVSRSARGIRVSFAALLGGPFPLSSARARFDPFFSVWRVWARACHSAGWCRCPSPGSAPPGGPLSCPVCGLLWVAWRGLVVLCALTHTGAVMLRFCPLLKVCFWYRHGVGPTGAPDYLVSHRDGR